MRRIEEDMEIELKELIYPVFVKDGKGLREEIPLMPGVFRMSPDVLSREAGDLAAAGIKNVLIFGVPGEKDHRGTSAYGGNDVVARAIKSIRSAVPRMTIFTDVCLCAYTSHGHCGIIKEGEGKIDNAETLEALSRMALAHAEAGADYVSPSAMAKGQVSAIRKALDARGYADTRIMAYSAKFASGAYGPFRNVADSAPRFGDRKGYQLDPFDREGALRKIEDDVSSGADIVMVKPALWYLDIVREAKSRVRWPLAVYNVSGEYSMVKEGVKNGMWEEKEIVSELLSSMKRAGADLIITYHAKEIAGWLK